MYALLFAALFAVEGKPSKSLARRTPSEDVAAITCDDAVRVLNLLGGAGIPATADGPFVYYAVKVPPRDAARARSLLKADAARRGYWLQLTE